MQVVTAVIQAICLLLGYSDKHDAFMKDCLTRHNQTECQQLWSQQ